MSDDTISRQEAIEALYQWMKKPSNSEEWQELLGVMQGLPPAQPELDEWCTDCKEYDQEKHCCPRWNRVIRNALKDAHPEPKWIPVTERLPEEDGGLYLVTDYVKSIGRRRMHLSRCYINKEGFWSEVPIGYKVIAWMPLPKPYEGSEDADSRNRRVREDR